MKDYKADFHQMLKERRKGKTEAEKAPAALLIAKYFVTYIITVSWGPYLELKFKLEIWAVVYLVG